MGRQKLMRVPADQIEKLFKDLGEEWRVVSLCPAVVVGWGQVVSKTPPYEYLMVVEKGDSCDS